MFASLCLYLCILVVFSLLHHYKDDVIMQNSGVAKKLVAVSSLQTHAMNHHIDSPKSKYLTVTKQRKGLITSRHSHISH